MQGYFQVSSFGIPREPVAGEPQDDVIVDYIIISRRSRDRAGLRYQRRGIGEEGHVANFVETESIMQIEVCHLSSSNSTVNRTTFQREGNRNIFSYVQIRGSSV